MSRAHLHNDGPSDVLEVRRYQATDRDDVWRLHLLALEPTGAIPRSAGWADDLRRIDDEYLDGGGEFLVGMIERMVVAMGALRRASMTCAEIKRMRVHPDHQRRGLVQRILGELESRASEIGLSTLHLETTVQQHAARELYIKNGYTEDGRATAEGFEVVRYEKTIDGGPEASVI